MGDKPRRRANSFNFLMILHYNMYLAEKYGSHFVLLAGIWHQPAKGCARVAHWPSYGIIVGITAERTRLL
jgi:hypothetical protein